MESKSCGSLRKQKHKEKKPHTHELIQRDRYAPKKELPERWKRRELKKGNYQRGKS